MVKKKEKELTYMQMPLPSGRGSYKQTKVLWSSLNMRQIIDSGELSKEKNISTIETPYLTPSQKWEDYLGEDYHYNNPISMVGFEDFLIVVYENNNAIWLDYIKDGSTLYRGMLKDGNITKDDKKTVRSIVQFNLYDTVTDPLSGNYIKKLVIFPDKMTMFMNIVELSGKDPASDDWEDYSVEYAEDSEGNNIRTVNWGSFEGLTSDVLYCVVDNDKGNRYYTLVWKKENENDEDSELIPEMVQSGEAGYFLPDSMTVETKSYSNETEQTDESGATIYPPPEGADKNCYYYNTAKNEYYHYCEYEAEDGSMVYGWKVSMPPTVPNIKYATVHLSRIFGVDDVRVYASGYNNYANWNLDTVGEYNESNAWCSPAQSNTKAGGSFTGITTFGSHVICFKHDFMHEIYNTYNPFRLSDVFAEGAIDNRTIQDVDGRLIFVSSDGVKVYTGSNPRNIGYYLGIDKFTNATSGTDGRLYYLYCEDENGKKRVLVYDTFSDSWSEQEALDRIIGFAHNKSGMYALSENGVIYKLDSGLYDHDWSFETDIIMRQSVSSSSAYSTVNIKHIKKLQMLTDISEDANIKVYFLYDNEEFDEKKPESHHLVYDSKGKTGRIPIRVKPRNTAHYGIKLHACGKGYVKFYELEMFFEYGGDLYV